MRNYSWYYGIFHWFVHYILTIAFVTAANISIVPIYTPFTLFGMYFRGNIVDQFIVIVISSLIDLDHLFILKKFGFKRYIWAEKRVVAPLHNFFVLAVLSVITAFSAIFVSKIVSVILFAVVLHIIWDMIEDVFIFRTSFRKWEKTWGLNQRDLEQTYNEVLQMEAQQPKKESRITKVKKIGSKLKEKIRKKKISSAATMELS